MARGIRRTHEQFVEEVKELVGEGYSVIGKYKTNKTKITFSHNACGNKYEAIPSAFLTGRRCPKCFGKNKKNTESFKEDVYNLVGNEYEVIGEYIHSKENITIRHNCGNKFDMTPNNFLKGQQCPKCAKKQSKGETAIESFLINNKIDYKKEYRFSDCRNKNPLPFDFAIFKDGEIDCLIEFDGIQHFQDIEGWGETGKLERTRNNDIIKNKYCKDNNMPLIRIPYYQLEDIENILSKEVIKNGTKENR